MPEERKLVTVLFADVTGSTSLGEELDPEDVRALMGRYYEHARDVVHAHDGTLEKFIGDAVMAVFGLPRAHGDDAERAVAAALALRDRVAQDGVLGQHVALRIGVNTGEVVATSDPTSEDFLVTGDAVNIAARLQQGASPGEILAGERTYAATRAGFLFERDRRVEVKGKTEPLRVFPVVGVRPVRQVDHPPLVDREQDLAQLALLHRRAVEARRPQLVSIVAPAGAGKTRLLEEFLGRLDPGDGVQVATGRCPPYGQTLTYWPLRGLLSDLLGEVERDRVVEAFARGGSQPEDAARLAHLVLAPLGLRPNGVMEQESIFTAWRLLIETLARETPRIVVFEDLHWASDSLLDLVEHVMHPRTQAPLLIIATSRPELLDRRPAWGGGRRSFTALSLEPLSDEETSELVGLIVETLPKGIRRRIVERSGGNPFFVTELVRGLAERGIAGNANQTDAVPDTVHAAVLARLDLLTPAERAVLQAAAVGGRTFLPAAVQAVRNDLPSEDLDAALDGLLARDLIVPEGRDAFTFRHMLIRDVAYGTLSRTERIRTHAAVARWIEGHAADRLDEFAELIAHHYREAVMLSRQSTIPLPLPFDPARAVRFLERAGQLASRSGALAEARNHLQSAITIAPLEEHGRLYEELGDCAVRGWMAREAYQEALLRWRGAKEKDPLAGARLLRKLLNVIWRFGAVTPADSDELFEMQAEARRLAEAAGDTDEIWRLRVAELFPPFLRNILDGVGITKQEAEEGRATALAAAAYAEQRGDWEFFSAALDGYTCILNLAGMRGEMIETSKRRLSAPGLSASEHGDALGVLAEAYVNLGDYIQCLTVVREALENVRPGDPIAHLRHATLHAIFAAWISGRWSDLPELTAWLEDILRQTPPDVVPGGPGAYFGALHVALARDDRAAAVAASAILERQIPESNRFGRALLLAYLRDDGQAIVVESTSFGWYLLFFSLLFFTERGLPPPEALMAAVPRAKEVGPADALNWCVPIAEALAARDPVQLSETIDDAEQHDLVPHVARMRIVLAEMKGDPAPLEQARAVLEQLQDRQFLRRLEEVASTLSER